MLILGIDPGTTSAGYALLENQDHKLKIITADLFKVNSSRGEERLMEIHNGVRKLIKDWRPQILALERLFFASNQKTALDVAQARGVILLTAALAGLKVYEYTPLEIKKIVSGDGKADKNQIKKILGLTLPEVKNLKAADDVFDAIATALACHYKDSRFYAKDLI